MKIAQVVLSLPEGSVSSITIALSQLWRSMGVENEIICNSNQTLDSLYYDVPVRSIRLFGPRLIHSLSTRLLRFHFMHLVYARLISWRFDRFLRQHKYDIVIFQGVNMYLMLHYIRTPHILVSHSIMSRRFAANIDKPRVWTVSRAWQGQRKTLLKCYHHVNNIVVSDDSRDDLIQNLGC